MRSGLHASVVGGQLLSREFGQVARAAEVAWEDYLRVFAGLDVVAGRLCGMEVVLLLLLLTMVAMLVVVVLLLLLLLSVPLVYSREVPAAAIAAAIVPAGRLAAV